MQKHHKTRLQDAKDMLNSLHSRVAVNPMATADDALVVMSTYLQVL